MLLRRFAARVEFEELHWKAGVDWFAQDHRTQADQLLRDFPRTAVVQAADDARELHLGDASAQFCARATRLTASPCSALSSLTILLRLDFPIEQLMKRMQPNFVVRLLFLPPGSAQVRTQVFWGHALVSWSRDSRAANSTKSMPSCR